MNSRHVLITGASGLLGTCVRQVLKDAGISFVGLCNSQRGDASLMPVDLCDPADVKKLFYENAFTHVVHCAAVRSPEACLADPALAYGLNAVAVEYLAREVNASGAWLCHVGTDYVFDGKNPPYREDDRPNPCNLYGRTKLAGEFAARTAERHLVLRIPALYRADPTVPGNVLTAFAAAIRENQLTPQDEETVRYYTLADDVAKAILFALEKELTGVLHVSAEQKTTKADFAQMICRMLGEDESRVKRCPPPATEDERPHDSHLSSEKYKQLGGPVFSSIDKALGL